MYSVLGEELTSETDVSKYLTVLQRVGDLAPAQIPVAVWWCVRDAQALHDPTTALNFITKVSSLVKLTTGHMLQITDVLEQVMLNRDSVGHLPVDDDQLAEAVAMVIRHLSAKPWESQLRIKLVSALSAEISGFSGVSLLAVITLRLFENGFARNAADGCTGCSPRELLDKKEFLQAIFAWLSEQSPVLVTRVTLPTELVTESPDELIPAILRGIDYIGQTLNTDQDVSALMTWVGLGCALARHSHDPEQEVTILQIAAGRMASSGRNQIARDWAEEVLQSPTTSTRRTRLTWFTFADIYFRTQNTLEGLVALACSFAVNAALKDDEIMSQICGAVRAFRDLGLYEPALTALEEGWRIADEFHILERYRTRLDSLRLQLLLVKDSHHHLTFERTLTDLWPRIVANARDVLKEEDDPLPVALLLAQGIRGASNSLSDLRDARDLMHALLERVGPRMADLVRSMASAYPDPNDILQWLHGVENARYSHDIGFDSQKLNLLARRFLAGPRAVSEPEAGVFAMELVTDRAVAKPGWELTNTPPPLPADVAEPARIAQAISRQNLGIVFVAFDAEWRLVRATATTGHRFTIFREPEQVFSIQRFSNWRKEFPFRYGIDGDTFNLFYTSMEGLGLSELPLGRVLFITDIELQQLPHNLWLVQGELAGLSRPMAAAPSAAWLAASRQHHGLGNGKRFAWISDSESRGQTLSMISERLLETFERFGVQLDRSRSLPEGFNGSDLVVVAAHGGVFPKEQHFQLVTDDGEIRVSASDLAEKLQNVALVILFVCSGGRLDKHPDSYTTIGLAKQLLDRGCRAVIASPWPLDARVPSHWLPEFLTAWLKDTAVIEATFEANLAVAKQMGDDPSRCLAMHLYGDPLLTR